MGHKPKPQAATVYNIAGDVKYTPDEIAFLQTYNLLDDEDKQKVLDWIDRAEQKKNFRIVEK